MNEPVVVAIDFGGSKIAACSCTPSGDEFAKDVVETTPSQGAEANFARGVALARRLADGARVLAVGACTFGVPRDGGIALAPAIDGWGDLQLRKRLEESFGACAAVATDVKVAASAEARHGALVGSDPALYLNLGTGLAVGIVVAGRVLTGAHGAAGEIGYCLPRERSARVTVRGSEDGGARRAVTMLEDVVSGMGLARALSARRGDRAEVATGAAPRTAEDPLRVGDLFGPSARDEEHELIVEQFLEELCFHMVNLTVAVDPERIAVGGGLVRAWDKIGAPLRRSLDRHVPYPPELVLAAFPFDAPLRGAVDLALDLAIGRAPDGASLGRGFANPHGVVPESGRGVVEQVQQVHTREEGLRTDREAEQRG